VSTAEAELKKTRHYWSHAHSVSSPATLPERAHGLTMLERVPVRSVPFHSSPISAGAGVIVGHLTGADVASGSFAVGVPMVFETSLTHFDMPAALLIAKEWPQNVLVLTTAECDQRDPFIELRDTKVNAAKATIAFWALNREAGAALVRRLTELVDMACEEYPDTEIPGQQTLDSVFSFFRARKDVRDPTVTLTASGGVWLEWRPDPHHSAALEFRRNGLVNLAALFPDPDQPLVRGALTGNYSWKSAAREIRTNTALSWLLTEHG